MRNFVRNILILTFLTLYTIPLFTYNVKLHFFQPEYDQTEKSILKDLSNINPCLNSDLIISYLKEWNEYQLNKAIYNRIPEKYRRFVLSFCSQNEIPVKYIYACYQLESGWSEYACGYNAYSYDIGIAQLNSSYAMNHARDYFKSGPLHTFNPWNWKMNLEVGMGLLNGLYKEFDGNFTKMLIAYNAGRYAVYNNCIPASTKMYIKKIQVISYSV